MSLAELPGEARKGRGMTAMEMAPIFPRPRGFRPAVAVTSARLAEVAPKGLSGGRHTGVRKIGKDYERKVLRWLKFEQAQAAYVGGKAAAGQLFCAPWIEFASNGSPRLCQPDAVLLTPRGIVVYEIKLKHSQMAYWQLRHLYGPVCASVWPDLPIAVCEITRFFDPATPWPEPCRLLSSPFDALGTTGFGVLTWR